MPKYSLEFPSQSLFKKRSFFLAPMFSAFKVESLICQIFFKDHQKTRLCAYLLFCIKKKKVLKRSKVPLLLFYYPEGRIVFAAMKFTDILHPGLLLQALSLEKA